jgi:hypothetical protein
MRADSDSDSRVKSGRARGRLHREPSLCEAGDGAERASIAGGTRRSSSELSVERQNLAEGTAVIMDLCKGCMSVL